MASVMKFSDSAVSNQLRHIERTIINNSNEDIDNEKREADYCLAPDRGKTAFDYYKQRKSELYCYGRDDVKVMAGWIVTAPQDLSPAKEADFFQETYNFLAGRYGEKNVVQAIVHKDESGAAHLHFCFIPVVQDEKHGGEKICANDVLTREELRNFHPDLQRYLSDHNIKATVYSGITKRQGGNRTVKELKAERSWNHKHERGWRR